MALVKVPKFFFYIRLLRGNCDYNFFGQAKGGQGNSKHTPCIDINSFIYFPRLPNRSMPVNNPLVTMVILRPVSANRTTIRMKFSCRVPVKDKGFYFFICSSDQGCFDSGMGNDCLNLRKYKIQWSMVI